MPKIDLYSVAMQNIDQVENRLIEDSSGRKLVTDIIKAGVERTLSTGTLFGTLRSGSTSTGDAGTGGFTNIAGGQVVYSRQLMPTEFEIDANDGIAPSAGQEKVVVNQITLNINTQKMIRQTGNIVDFAQLGTPQGQSILNAIMNKQMQRVEDTLDRAFITEMYESTAFVDANISAGTLLKLTDTVENLDPTVIFEEFEDLVGNTISTQTDEITGIDPSELFVITNWKTLSKLRRAPMYQGAGSSIESQKFISGANQIGIAPADVILGVPVYVSERLPVAGTTAGEKGKTVMIIGVHGSTAIEFADYKTGVKEVAGRLTQQYYMTEYSFGTKNIFPDLVSVINEPDVV